MPDINAQYNVAAPGSLPVRLAAKMRRRMFADFLEQMAPQPSDLILDVGATSDDTYEASNYLEAWYPHKERITALGLDDASHLEQRYPGLRYVRGDGRDLPFDDCSFDLVHSSAVLEHVGSRAQQAAFLGELLRVARRGVYLTTPNRWFPVEFHSVLPLVHWLPPAAFRAVLRGLGHGDLACEENLNLLGPDCVRALCAGLVPMPRATVRTLKLWGWPSNIVCSMHRR
jgi:Methylase involved in ubiquinone/menaquinone biosynthesis